MKTKMLRVALTGIITGVSLTAMTQEDKQAAEVPKDVTEANKQLGDANQDLRETQIDSAADFKKFKKESEMKISENQNQIIALKNKKSMMTNEVSAKYDEEVLALDQKNNVLKMKIRGSANTKTSKWASFKSKFNHDVDELGRAIKDLDRDNTK